MNVRSFANLGARSKPGIDTVQNQSLDEYLDVALSLGFELVYECDFTSDGKRRFNALARRDGVILTCTSAVYFDGTAEVKENNLYCVWQSSRSRSPIGHSVSLGSAIMLKSLENSERPRPHLARFNMIVTCSEFGSRFLLRELEAEGRFLNPWPALVCPLTNVNLASTWLVHDGDMNAMFNIGMLDPRYLLNIHYERLVQMPEWLLRAMGSNVHRTPNN